MSSKDKTPETVIERMQKYRASMSEEKKAIARAKDNNRKKEKRQIWKTEDKKKYKKLADTEKNTDRRKKHQSLTLRMKFKAVVPTQGKHRF